MTNISIREFVRRFEAGEFEDAARSVQCDAGWYDWFCKAESLRNKTRFLGRRVVQLSKSKKIDVDTMYVFFKNNCPMRGRLYDSFSICSLKTGDVLYWITCSNGHDGDDFGKPQVSDFVANKSDCDTYNNWREVRDYFGV